MNKTKIEWVKNPDGSQGYTWNPITGCLNHVNGLCKGGGFPCYAYRLAHGRLKGRYWANSNLPMHNEPNHQAHHSDPFYPRFWQSRLTPLHTPRKSNSPKKGIFVCDMGELFGDWIPQGWQDQVFNTIKANPDYRFYLLTKQPQNLIKWSPFPENAWVGVSCPDANALYYAIPWLDEIKVSRKFISFEPLLKSMWGDCLSLAVQLVHWLIIGQQTPVSAKTEPKIEWIKEIVEAADKAGIPVFLKDNLLELVNYQSPETDFAFNKEGCYRQELPGD